MCPLSRDEQDRQVHELLRPDFAKRIRTTPAQRSDMCKAMSDPEAYRNEKVWTMLVADLLARAPDQQRLVRLLCGCDVDGRLTVQWVTYEEILQQHFGTDLDIVQGAERIGGLKEHLHGLVRAMQLQG